MIRFQNLFRPCGSIFNPPATFYCAECDSSERMVKSDDPSTGLFFTSPDNEVLLSGGKVGVECHMVVFAICHECLTKTGFIDLLPKEEDNG